MSLKIYQKIIIVDTLEK